MGGARESGERAREPGSAQLRLISAVRQGDADAARQALADGAVPRAKGPMVSPMIAVAMGFEDAKALGEGTEGCLAALRALLAAGADPSDADEHRVSALMITAQNAAPIEAVRALVEAGADMEARDAEGHSALSRAARRGQTEKAAELIRLGARADTRCHEGFSPAQTAWAKNHFETARVLEELTPESFKRGPSRLDALLLEAARRGQGEKMREMLKAGADASARVPEDGYLALHALLKFAFDESDEKSVASALDGLSALLAAGADAAASSASGWSALHYAARYNAPASAFSALLAAGADIEARDQSGASPLAIAVRGENAAAVAELSRLGADPFAPDNEGDTPLSQALEKEDAILAPLKAAVERERLSRALGSSARPAKKRALLGAL